MFLVDIVLCIFVNFFYFVLANYLDGSGLPVSSVLLSFCPLLQKPKCFYLLFENFEYLFLCDYILFFQVIGKSRCWSQCVHIRLNLFHEFTKDVRN